jgi:CRP/FNR family transcriptional regulator
LALLKQLPLFADLPERELLALAHLGRVDHFPADGVIFSQGDPCDRLWLLNRGKVKIVYHEEDGREVILELISPGEPFGGTTLFFPRHPATAKAIDDVETFSLSGEAYRQFLIEHPTVTLKLIRMLGARLHSMMEAQIAAGKRVEQRLARILLKHAARFGRPDPEGTLIPISLSRQDLADMSGTTLETAIRVMSRFRAQEWVKTRRGGFLVILNEAELRKLARGL